MKLSKRINQAWIGAVIFFHPILCYAQEALQNGSATARDTGISGLWVLANISYAGMCAQDNPSAGWRVLSFIFGFPGTLISFFAIDEGGERAYGIDLPKKLR